MPLDYRLRGNDGLLLFCNRYQEIILTAVNPGTFSPFRCLNRHINVHSGEVFRSVFMHCGSSAR
jgi:hypothetical protein